MKEKTWKFNTGHPWAPDLSLESTYVHSIFYDLKKWRLKNKQMSYYLQLETVLINKLQVLKLYNSGI